jgi:large repetitive protein
VITGAGSHSFTGLPVGARCSLSQTDASLTPQGISYRSASGTTSAGSSHTEVVSGTQAVTLTAIDNFDTQPLIIEKVLSGTGANDFAVHPFTFSVTCTLTENGATEAHVVYTNDAVTLSKADGLISAGLGPVPIGAKCTVTETANGGATVASDPQTVTISATAENRATLTNAFDTGKVLVTKKVLVDGTASDAEPYASGTYTMKLACTQEVDGQTLPVTIPGGDTRTVTGSGTAEFSALPLGATCAVSESASSLAIPSDQVTIDTPTITVGTDSTKVEVANAFRTSDLLVKVGFTGVGKDTFAKPVSLEVNCTLDGAASSVLHQVLEVAPTPGQDFTTAGPLGPIPVGAVCTITPLTAHGADAVPQKVEVTGEQGTTAVAEVAATYSAGTVTVIKKLAGSGASQHTNETFTMEVTCRQSEGGDVVASGTVTIVGSGSATLSDGAGNPVLAPSHSHCWATETATGGATKVSIDHGSFTTAVHVDPDLPDTLQQLSITVTNTFATSADDLAFTGYALGWGLPSLGLLSIGLGIWLTRRRRQDESN